MRVGVFTALLANLSLDQVIAKLKALGVSTVELGTGNYPGDPHCKLSMLDDSGALAEFKKKLDDNGMSISALSCHGDPLHPNPEIARLNQETNRRTILLAETATSGAKAKRAVTAITSLGGPACPRACARR